MIIAAVVCGSVLIIAGITLWRVKAASPIDELRKRYPGMPEYAAQLYLAKCETWTDKPYYPKDLVDLHQRLREQFAEAAATMPTDQDGRDALEIAVAYLDWEQTRGALDVWAECCYLAKEANDETTARDVLIGMIRAFYRMGLVPQRDLSLINFAFNYRELREKGHTFPAAPISHKEAIDWMVECKMHVRKGGG